MAEFYDHLWNNREGHCRICGVLSGDAPGSCIPRRPDRLKQDWFKGDVDADGEPLVTEASRTAMAEKAWGDALKVAASCARRRGAEEVSDAILALVPPGSSPFVDEQIVFAVKRAERRTREESRVRDGEEFTLQHDAMGVDADALEAAADILRKMVRPRS